MNKTVSIALAGFSFMIEEHAYMKLKDYLQALRGSLEPSEADEVMNDIEIRMVEIFKETLAKREVINNLDVESVINRIGKPEEIEEQEEAYYSESNSKKSAKKGATEHKQLFRDPERQKVAGVCSGISHYTGLDVSIIRIIWIGFPLLTHIMFDKIMNFDTGLIPIAFILYIILWIALPKAKTASDFLKMKGEPLNFDNLKKESNKIVEFANDSSKKVGQIYNENRPIINKTGSSIGNLFRYVFGVIFALIAVTSILGIFNLTVFSAEQDILGKVGFYLQDSDYFQWVPMTFGIVSVLIPAFLFSYLAMKLLSPKTKLNYTGYVFGGLILIWLALLSIIAYAAIKQNTKYNGTKNEKEKISIQTTSDSIIIARKNVIIPENFKSYWSRTFSDKVTVYKKDYIDVEVTRQENTKPHLIIKTKADGYNHPLKLDVPVNIVNNRIELPNYVSYPYKYRMRGYKVYYELIVPTNTIIVNDDKNSIDIEDAFDDDDNDDTNANVKINIGGNKIELNSEDNDSIIINGKKLSKEEAEKMMKKQDLDFDDIKNIDLKINDGESKISIETK